MMVMADDFRGFAPHDDGPLDDFAPLGALAVDDEAGWSGFGGEEDDAPAPRPASKSAPKSAPPPAPEPAFEQTPETALDDPFGGEADFSAATDFAEPDFSFEGDAAPAFGEAEGGFGGDPFAADGFGADANADFSLDAPSLDDAPETGGADADFDAGSLFDAAPEPTGEAEEFAEAAELEASEPEPAAAEPPTPAPAAMSEARMDEFRRGVAAMLDEGLAALKAEMTQAMEQRLASLLAPHFEAGLAAKTIEAFIADMDDVPIATGEAVLEAPAAMVERLRASLPDALQGVPIRVSKNDALVLRLPEESWAMPFRRVEGLAR